MNKIVWRTHCVRDTQDAAIPRHATVNASRCIRQDICTEMSNN